MCGRFTQHYTWAEVYAFLNVLGVPRKDYQGQRHAVSLLLFALKTALRAAGAVGSMVAAE